MKFNADSYHCTGASHHFCEDFSSSNVSADADKAFAVVCDGCSSAKQSMIGSMLLAKSAEQFLYPVKQIDQSDEVVQMAIHEANTFRRTMNLNVEVLCATLLSVTATSDSLRASITGDGVIVARHKEHGLEFLEVEYSSGAPFYPRYNLSSNDLHQYLNEFPGDYIHRRHSKGEVEEITKPVNMESGVPTYAEDFSLEEYDLVGIMSDGSQSFYYEEMSGTTKTRNEISVGSIVEEMFAFKNVKGEFVKRRTQKAFKSFAKKNWKHYDDFSIGVVVAHE